MSPNISHTIFGGVFWMIKKWIKMSLLLPIFIPKDLLDIICILERDGKHIRIKLYVIGIFSRRQISHQECSIDAIEEQRFRLTTSESSGQEKVQYSTYGLESPKFFRYQPSRTNEAKENENTSSGGQELCKAKGVLKTCQICQTAKS